MSTKPRSRSAVKPSTTVEMPKPAPVLAQYANLPALTPLAPKVVVSSRRAFGEKPAEAEIDWPSEWRLPVAGDSVRLADGSGGFIAYVTWDLERRAVVVTLR